MADDQVTILAHFESSPAALSPVPVAMVGGVFVLAMATRVAAAFVVEHVARGRGTLCLFGDTAIYWELAGELAAGRPYQVLQYGIPHGALRAPGYPLWLVPFRALGGESTLPIRLAQAVLGAWSVLTLMRLVAHLERGGGREGGPAWRSPVVLAGLIAAVEPWSVGMSVLLLSEALFVPLMLTGLLGLAMLTERSAAERKPEQWVAIAFLTGVIHGAAILVRPSWALFPPLALLAWGTFAGRGNRRRAIARISVVSLGIAITMSPWWARNARVYDRFVPTVLWLGASLYDGLNPGATGASDMRFLDDPQVRVLGESTQDRELSRRAITFAQDHPARVWELALIKAGRYWSPWPHAEEVAVPGVAFVSALTTIPIYIVILIGIVDRRRDLRLLGLLLGPLLFFSAIHMVFVGSMRYRIPAIVPAFGLAGIGLGRVLNWGRTDDDRRVARVRTREGI